MENIFLQTKDYKAVTPDVTINKIRDILRDLDLFVFDSPRYIDNNDNDIYVFSTFIANRNMDKLFIGSHGKGMSLEYALASAYGEFIERLENFFLLPNLPRPALASNDKNSKLFLKEIFRKKLFLEFNIAPDEKPMKVSENIDEWLEIFHNAYDGDKDMLLNHIGQDSTLCLPFYEVNDQKVRYLPFSITNHHSNGFCAGNTKEEALIQGFSEIFERYAFDKIFFEGICPPDIPIDYFKGQKIYTVIKNLEIKHNLTIIIKDCSLGKGVPVLGALIIDKANNKYAFHLGADPYPVTALERTITEDIQVGFLENMLEINPMGNNFQYKSKYNSRLFEYLNSSRNYRGRWLDSIFSNKPSYEFKGFEYVKSESDASDLKFLMDKFEELNFRVFVRDTSFFEFPAFSIFIPGMNDLLFDYVENKEVFLKHKVSKNLFYNLIDLDDKDKKEVINSLEEAYEIGDVFYWDLDSLHRFIDRVIPYDYSHIQKSDFVLSILNYNLKEYKKAWFYIDKYIKSNSIKSSLLYCVRDLFNLVSEGESEEEIKNYLHRIYNTEIVENVIQNYLDPEKVLEHQMLPRCYNCEICSLKEYCRYFDVLDIKKRVQEKAGEVKIDQNLLGNVFRNLEVSEDKNVMIDQDFNF